MSERDPKLDPRPGDVLRKRTRYREVYKVDDGGRIVYWGIAKSCYAEDWRKWAASAEVITKADDSEIRTGETK